MKKQMMAAMCALAVLAACSETSEELVPEVKGEGVYATIEQPVSVDTKSLAYENGKLVFTWAEGEKVVVFGNKDAASFNSLTSGETSTKLESEGFTLKDNVNYYACLPAYTIPAATQSTSVPVTFMGQRQTANGNSDHLKSFDYACASATKAEGKNTISFELKNQVAWIVLDHTFTDATNNVTSVTINADEDLFVTKGTLDVTTSTITEGTKDRKITLNLGEEGGNGLSFAAGETFRGFFTLNPVDLSGKTLTFTATTKSGETVALGTFTKASANLTKNLAVRIQTSGSAKVATVDGKEYSTLSAALAAASEGATISVVSDVTTEKVLIDKSVTFDLGGHTVTADDDVFYIAENGLTVNFKNGNIVSTKYGGLFFKQGRQNEHITFDNCNITGVEGAIATSTLTGSTITINGGTFTSSNNAVILTNGNKRMYPYDETNTALRENPNTITINGGTFKGQMSDEAYNGRNSIACGIYAAWKDIIIVNDGTFEIERGVGVLCRGGKVTIKGGTFTTTDPDTKKGCVGDSRIVVPCQTVYVDKASQYPDYENATIEISGGKFSDDSCKDYLAEGYGIGRTYIESKNVWYTEVAEAVSEYDGMKYSSLQTAIEASENATKEITILKDMEVSQLTVYSNNKVTINLNGKNVNITGYEPNCTGVNIDGGSLTIKGSGSFGDSAQKNVNPLFYVNVGASLTIEGDASYYSANVCAYARYWNSKIYINGGKWYGSETYTLNKYDTNQEAIISVTGGEFYKYNPAASHSENPVANFVADGYGVVKDGDWYRVVKATEVTDEANLRSANTAGSAILINESIVLTEKNLSMQDGTSLYVAKDVVLSSEFTGRYYMTLSYLNKGGVISGEGTIVAPDKKNSHTSAVQFDSRNKELVIDGNLTIKGGVAGYWNGDEYKEGISPAIFIYDGKVTINNGHFIGGIDSETGNAGPAVYIYSNSVNNNAELIINGGVFESATDDATFLINMDDNNLGAASIQIKGGTFVGFNPADNTADGAGTNYVADGYVSTKTTYNGKDAWVVTKAK
jgi:hypothetical protein